MSQAAIRVLVVAPSLAQVRDVDRTDRLVVVAADPAVLEAAKRSGLKTSQLDAYAGARPSWDAALNLSHSWYRTSTEDLSRWDGLSMGEMVEVDMFLYFAELLEETDRLMRLLDAEQPDGLWLGEEAPRSWTRLLRFARPQISVRRLRVDPVSALRATATSAAVKEWLKAAAFDRVGRAASLAVRGPKSKAPGSADGIVLVIADIPTPSILGSLLPVIRALPAANTRVLATDPRVLARLRGIPVPVIAPAAGELAQGWRPYRDASSAFRARWPQVVSAAREAGAFDHDGVDLWPIVEPRLRRSFRRQLPLTAGEARVAASVLRRQGVKLIVTASHSHYAGRLYCEVGASLGIPSLSLQHGVAGIPRIYAPVHSTKMAVWGELPRQWLIDNGADPSQLVVTGQPRLDALIKPGPALSKAEVQRKLGLDSTHPVWTVAPDPAPREFRHMTTEMVFQIAEAFPENQIVIRPHPDDDPAYYAGRIAAWPGRGRIVVGSVLDAASLLAASDLLFVGQSTLGLEAMILGCPVISLNPSRTPEFVPYVGEGAAPGVHDSAELVPVIKRFLGADRDRYAAARRSFVERYALGADGRSTGRVVDLIADMARGAR